MRFIAGEEQLAQRRIAGMPKNLDLVVKAGWIQKDALCKGVDAAKAPAACK